MCIRDSLKILEEARLSGLSKTGEITWPDQRVFMALITPIESGGLVAILQDVTRFKDIERVKNEFIATASHDLKNPITAIIGFSELLSQAGPLNDMQMGFMHRIQDAASSMSELVQSMMQLAQSDLNAVQNFEPVEVTALLADVVDEFNPQAEAKEQALQFHPLDFPVYANSDRLQLKQLFRNLVGNAIKYTQQGGQIIVSMSMNMENIQVDVQDNGFGIPAADLPFIFDRFYRVRDGIHNKVEGNGLGLAIVKAIVEQHGGQVKVESEKNQGSCFQVSLPIMVNMESVLQKTDIVNISK